MSTEPRIIPIKPVNALPQHGSLFEAHKKVQARSVKGWFTNWRWAMVWLTQIVFYGLPWLPWNGRQAMLFDLNSRRFYIFDLVLYPQDFIYLAALLVLSALALFFFTTIAGRLWCGFACPQTVYTEIFMWIEQRIEGDRLARLKLDKAPWVGQKLLKRGGKHVAWGVFSLWTGLTFVGYFTPIRALLASISSFGAGPWELFWSVFYGMATYGNAGFLREQVCKYMCPYARFQSVMLDGDSLIVGYDTARGESRGSRSKTADRAKLGLGDCVDCTMCVQVCPVGIDIRNGFQMECIGCGACIDACDTVMDKMNYPRGLIRFSTQNGLAQGWDRPALLKRAVRWRTAIYGGALLIGVTAFAASLMTRAPFRVDITRDRGVMARMVDDGVIENVYRLHIMNSTELTQRYRVDVSAEHGVYGMRVDNAQAIDLAPSENRDVSVRIRLDANVAANLVGQIVPINMSIEQMGAAGQAVKLIERSTFVVPR
ncbi:MAG: cytochrome c oxidase accessory protein CcoG [Aquabacterium sp.]|uniref:cytochrome c oxidase accessory protein CcoG n=1 Tax=Aquabacterium sp. TaxID=1872578 RepID=UPI001218FB0A|nr:cytochrome c oxidase accessory protein CcoG [Aquabacterium sp.]TAK95757.1 MAG: cytochrome c oxidase accessory protein CcoG [Aquabacterium sp.]